VTAFAGPSLAFCREPMKRSLLLRGDIQDMAAAPMVAARSQIHLANNPSRGPADARVTV
jgi:hypothetical protein